MGRPPKPLEVKRRTGRSPGRDAGGRKLPTAVARLPGASETPPVPEELLTGQHARDCYVARAREDGTPCEACLAEVGARTWNRLWAAARTWLSVALDVDVLTRICHARIDELHLRVVLKEDGPLVQGQRGGLVAHPAVAQLRALNTEVVKLESACGFTPSARSQLGAAEVEAKSELEKILERRDPARRAASVPRRAAPRRRTVGSRGDEVD